MLPARGWSDLLGHGRRECNHVVLVGPLDFLDARYVESELTRWKPIVTAMNIKID